jgi:DNA gyrase subunit A
MRIVIELRRDAQTYVVMNNLFRHTALRSSFNTIMLALVDGQPQILPLKRCLVLFIEHRQVVIRRRSEYQLQKAQERDHVIQGLLLALDRMDEVIQIIRDSADVEAARNNLMTTLDLSEVQAQAILEMQLRRLAALERERLEKEHDDLVARITELEALLASPELVMAEIKKRDSSSKKDFQQPTPDRDPRCRARRPDRRVVHSPRRRNHHPQPKRLRETGAFRYLPHSAPRWQGRRRHAY